MPHMISRMPDSRNDKPALLFVHGAWHGAWCWDEFYLPYFAAQGFAAYALDLRGHGESPNSKSLRFTPLGDYVDDVAQAVAQIDGPVVVIGHSMGGMIVQRYLSGNHKAIAGVLMATVPWYGALSDALLFLKVMPLKLLKMMCTLSVYPLVENSDKAADLLLAHDCSAADKEKYMSRLQDESYIAFMQLTLPLFEKIATPLLVVGGEKDVIIKPKTQKTTADRHGAECRIIDNAPHDLMLDKTWKTLAKIIESWVNGLKTDSH